MVQCDFTTERQDCYTKGLWTLYLIWFLISSCCASWSLHRCVSASRALFRKLIFSGLIHSCFTALVFIRILEKEFEETTVGKYLPTTILFWCGIFFTYVRAVYFYRRLLLASLSIHFNESWLLRRKILCVCLDIIFVCLVLLAAIYAGVRPDSFSVVHAISFLEAVFLVMATFFSIYAVHVLASKTKHVRLPKPVLRERTIRYSLLMIFASIFCCTVLIRLGIWAYSTDTALSINYFLATDCCALQLMLFLIDLNEYEPKSCRASISLSSPAPTPASTRRSLGPLAAAAAVEITSKAPIIRFGELPRDSTFYQTPHDSVIASTSSSSPESGNRNLDTPPLSTSNTPNPKYRAISTSSATSSAASSSTNTPISRTRSLESRHLISFHPSNRTTTYVPDKHVGFNNPSASIPPPPTHHPDDEFHMGIEMHQPASPRSKSKSVARTTATFSPRESTSPHVSPRSTSLSPRSASSSQHAHHASKSVSRSFLLNPSQEHSPIHERPEETSMKQRTSSNRL